MKLPIIFTALLLLVSCSGCATRLLLEEARRPPRPMENLTKVDQTTGGTTVPFDHPEANYLLLPLAVSFDIATSPIQLSMLLLMTCRGS